jgi:hypothetical protein
MDHTHVMEWPRGVSYDAIRGLLLGEKLGEGNGRDREVYVCGFDDSLVVKVELTNNPDCQNVSEFRLWSIIDGTARDPGVSAKVREHFERMRAWLAPVVSLSDAGSLLVMKRTRPAGRGDFPKKVPRFLFDLKRENFGVYDGRLVCHDYGTLLGILGHNHLCTLDRGGKGKRAKWWGLEDYDADAPKA